MGNHSPGRVMSRAKAGRNDPAGVELLKVRYIRRVGDVIVGGLIDPLP